MLGEGVRAAFEFLGIEHRTVCYVEREAAAAAQLARLMEAGALDPAPVWSDLLTFNGAAWRGCVDFLVAGFPCQDISIAGRRAGLDGHRSGLFFDILNIADDCGAHGLFLENVSAIATATATAVDEAEGALEERAAARVVGELADRGWDAEWITLSASDVGASHGRARWFCLAWRRAMVHAGLHARGAQHGQQPQGPTGGLGQPGADGDSGNVADAERPRWQKTGGGSEIHPGRELEPRCSDVDDTHHAISEGRGLPADERQERADPRRTGQGADGTVAHTDGAGRGTEWIGECRHADAAPCQPAVADATGDRWNQGRAESGGQQGRPDAAERGGAVANTGQPGLPHAEQPELAGAWTGHERRAAAELRGAPLFAPGPLDPRWAGIVQSAPWLAPAIADPSGDGSKRRLNPRFAEWLMGWPIGWTENLNAKNTITCPGDQPGSHSQESAASRTGQWRALLQMRLKELVAAPSRGLQQANGCDVSLRCLSSQGAHPTAGELLDLRDSLSTQEDKAINAMRKPRMLEDHGAVECGKALENRAHRLRQVGNGVVPLQAAVALVELVRRAMD